MEVLEAPAARTTRPAPSEPSVPPDPMVAAESKTGLLQKPIVIVLIALCAIAAIMWSATILVHSLTYESTDDAFIDAHILSVAPKISGRVIAVRVTDNEIVKKGDVLVEIDPADVQAVLSQKRAAADVAQAKVRNSQIAAEQADAHLKTLHAGVEAAGASAVAAAADATKNRSDLERNKHLIAGGAISKQDFEHSTTDTAAAEATLDSKKKQMDAAEAYFNEAEKSAESAHLQIEASKAEAEEAEATFKQAELQASYAKIVAAEDGRVTNKAVEPGDYVQIGQALLAVVSQEVWVTANFKETQLRDMHSGEATTVAVDAYPGRPLRAHVDSIQAGSGARFSLVPPENATGNYVKVVQRVPVKIVFDEQPEVQRVLGPGMSAVPDVKVRGEFGAAVKVGIVAAIAVCLVLMGTALWIGRVRQARV
jgi:membrane fusion protein, multidrug efflux system